MTLGLHANITLQRRANQAGCSIRELSTVMKCHTTPRTPHQDMQIQQEAGTYFWPQVVIINPSFTRALVSSLTFSLQPVSERQDLRLCGSVQ